MSKKRLLITASTFPRFEGDTEPRFILDLAKAYKEYFDVTVLAPAAPEAKTEETIEGVHVLRYHYFPVHKCETLCYPGAIVPRIKEKKSRALLVPFLFLGLWGKLLKILPDYDYVHANWLIPQGFVQSFFRKKYLLTGHGGDIASLNGGVMGRVKTRAIRHASCFTVVSKDLKEKSKLLYPDADPSVISMGCDLSAFGKSNRRENYFGQNGRPVVLFVGRLAGKKGVPYLIEAVKPLDVILYIAGTGPMEEALKKQAEPLKDKVIFAGPKPHSELKTIYASADIFAAPSIVDDDGDQEGLPTAIMEAMASGVPVVSTRTGGIPELITDNENGLLVNDRDSEALSEAIRTLLGDEELRRRLAENAETAVRKRDYKVIAASFAELITGMCGEKK